METVPNEHHDHLREIARRKRLGLDVNYPASLSEAVNRMADNIVSMYIADHEVIRVSIDIKVLSTAELENDPIERLMGHTNRSMADALLEKILHDAFRAQLLPRIDKSRLTLRELRTKLLNNQDVCRYLATLDVVRKNDRQA